MLNAIDIVQQQEERIAENCRNCRFSMQPGILVCQECREGKKNWKPDCKTLENEMVKAIGELISKFSIEQLKNKQQEERIAELEEENQALKELVVQKTITPYLEAIEANREQFPVPTESIAMARAFKDLTEKKDKLKQESVEVNKKLTILNESLSTIMLSSNMGKFTIDGKLFYLDESLSVTTPKGNHEIVLNLLKENGYSDLVHSDYDAGNLKTIVSEYMTDHDGEVPPWLFVEGKPVVTVFNPTVIRMRKASVNRAEKNKRKKKGETEDED